MAQLASYATMLVAVATILGCLAMPTLAERFGRRGALAFFFALMMVFIVVLSARFIIWVETGCRGFLFACFSWEWAELILPCTRLWLPEQYPTECRASAFAFSTSFARFAGAGITFLVGAGVRHFGSYWDAGGDDWHCLCYWAAAYSVRG